MGKLGASLASARAAKLAATLAGKDATSTPAIEAISSVDGAIAISSVDGARAIAS